MTDVKQHIPAISTCKGGLMEGKNILTEEEREIMVLLVQSHIKFARLKSTHSNEMQEWVSGIHYLQSLLGMRILRREYPELFANNNG